MLKEKFKSGEDILAEAIKQPGIAELIKVYTQCNEIEKYFNLYMQQMQIPPIITLSTNTRQLGE